MDKSICHLQICHLQIEGMDVLKLQLFMPILHMFVDFESTVNFYGGV